MKTPCRYKGIANDDRLRILNRDNYTCQDCSHKGKHGLTLDCIQVHHIIPSRLGGSNDDNNLITLCGKCHKQRDRTYWVASMREWQKRCGYKNLTER